VNNGEVAVIGTFHMFLRYNIADHFEEIYTVFRCVFNYINCPQYDKTIVKWNAIKIIYIASDYRFPIRFSIGYTNYTHPRT